MIKFGYISFLILLLSSCTLTDKNRNQIVFEDPIDTVQNALFHVEQMLDSLPFAYHEKDGVPQNRRRAVFVGLLNNQIFEFPVKTIEFPVTSWEAISDLPDIDIIDGENYPNETRSEYQQIMRQNSTNLYNQQLTAHSEKTIETIALVPDGGNYKSLPAELQKIRNVKSRIPIS